MTFWQLISGLDPAWITRELRTLVCECNESMRQRRWHDVYCLALQKALIETSHVSAIERAKWIADQSYPPPPPPTPANPYPQA